MEEATGVVETNGVMRLQYTPHPSFGFSGCWGHTEKGDSRRTDRSSIFTFQPFQRGRIVSGNNTRNNFQRGYPMSDTYGKVIAEAGGPVDECGVCLAIYGEELIPNEITSLLGCQPTHSHRRGDRMRDGSQPFKVGAWLIEERGEPPDTAEVLTRRILQRVQSDPDAWKEISQRFAIQLRYGLHMNGWNKGLELPADLVATIAQLYASLEFDIYAYENDT